MMILAVGLKSPVSATAKPTSFSLSPDSQSKHRLSGYVIYFILQTLQLRRVFLRSENKPQELMEVSS